MHHSPSATRLRRLAFIPAIGIAVAACGGAGSSAGPATAAASPAPSAVVSVPAAPTPVDSASASVAAGDSQAPASSPGDAGASEAPGGNTSGDVPDNAAFLTYKGTSPGFSIQYVEGWQVTPKADGVVIRDKDSSETVTVVSRQSDVAAFVAATDLPALQTQPGFKLVKQDAVKAGGATYVHIAYHQASPPDPVTGKQVPQTVDRYYVPGPAGLAVVSLATPDGVDNVDAFRQMIESFKWS